MSPHDRFIRRVFALGGCRLRRGDERRFRVEIDGPIVRVWDDFDVPVLEVTPVSVSTRRDKFPDGFDDERVRAAIRAAKRLLKGNVNG